MQALFLPDKNFSKTEGVTPSGPVEAFSGIVPGFDTCASCAAGSRACCFVAPQGSGFRLKTAKGGSASIPHAKNLKKINASEPPIRISNEGTCLHT